MVISECDEGRPWSGWTGRWRSAMVRLAGRFRCARLPAVAAVLVAVERALVGEVARRALLRALPVHGDAWADPVVPVLALMALVAEILIGYVLVMLVLRWSRVAGRLGAGRRLDGAPLTRRR